MISWRNQGVLARATLLLLCLGMSRLGWHFMVGSLTSYSGGVDAEMAAALDELGIDASAMGGPPPTGDGLRAGPIHVDQERAGQVVTRNGELVVLLDDLDPDHEIYVPLAGGPPRRSHPIQRIDPLLASGGLGVVFFAGILGVGWLFLHDEGEKVASTTPPTTNDPPSTPPNDGISW